MKEYCIWNWKEDCYFETACGSAWHYTDGGSDPNEHSQYYCHHCGKELEVDEASLENVDEEVS